MRQYSDRWRNWKESDGKWTMGKLGSLKEIEGKKREKERSETTQWPMKELERKRWKIEPVKMMITEGNWKKKREKTTAENSWAKWFLALTPRKKEKEKKKKVCCGREYRKAVKYERGTGANTVTGQRNKKIYREKKVTREGSKRNSRMWRLNWSE